MKRLGFTEYQSLVSGGHVVAHDSHGAKVIETGDGRVVKLFRTKRLLSAARWNPYAERFARNADMLTGFGINTVKVTGVYRVPDIGRDIVIYSRLEGDTLRDVIAQGSAADMFDRFARFLAQLHHNGVLFRSIHFGNVLCMPNGELGLIDVADMRTRRAGALTLKQRMRNFRHMLRYREDRDALHRFGVDRFMEHYAEVASIAAHDCSLLHQALNELIADQRR